MDRWETENITVLLDASIQVILNHHSVQSADVVRASKHEKIEAAASLWLYDILQYRKIEKGSF